jgi:hypothetical protein
MSATVFDLSMRFDSNKYRHPTLPNQQIGLDLLADALFDARQVREFTQHELAFRTGVAQSTISRLEHGIAPGVSLRRLGGVIAVFGGIQFGPRRMTREEFDELLGVQRPHGSAGEPGWANDTTD